VIVEVLTVVRMIMLFSVLTPYRLVGRDQRFGETYCLHPQGWMFKYYILDIQANDTVIYNNALYIQSEAFAATEFHVVL
jgi:hypothetical protein